MSTTIKTTTVFNGTELTGTPLAVNSRTTPLTTALSYTEAAEGVNMVWSQSVDDSPGTQVNLDLSALTDDRGTVTFTQVHGYTINVRSGSIEFPNEIAGTDSYRYQPVSHTSATVDWLLTGPGQLTFSSAAAAGDAITGTTNKLFAFWPSTGADYDIIFYGVGTIA